MILKVIYESILQAGQQIGNNKLRSFLSSLGITIGIFCIMSVLSAVDSLEKNISHSFEKLGKDVIYVDKNPWNEDPNTSSWKYARRPSPDFDDLRALQAKVATAEYASLAVFIPGRTIKYKANHVQGLFMAGITYEYVDITRLDFADGRYFTPYEYAIGANRVILGALLAESLFGDVDPLGKEITIAGQKFVVIGVLQEEGQSLVQIIPFDQAVFISYNTVKKLINVRTGTTYGTMLNVKARPNVELVDLQDEVRGVLRAHRKLRPKEDDNFALNKLSTITNALEQVFAVMNVIGFVIGFFAIIVGILSVANIMFVSVRERTNIIGIKKALGAKRPVILLEFLIESVILCLFGGAIGLILVIVILELLSGLANYEMFVSFTNILLTIAGAVVIGVVAGIIPAFIAAKMDPVEAIRSK